MSFLFLLMSLLIARDGYSTVFYAENEQKAFIIKENKETKKVSIRICELSDDGDIPLRLDFESDFVRECAGYKEYRVDESEFAPLKNTNRDRDSVGAKKVLFGLSKLDELVRRSSEAVLKKDFSFIEYLEDYVKHEKIKKDKEKNNVRTFSIEFDGEKKKQCSSTLIKREDGNCSLLTNDHCFDSADSVAKEAQSKEKLMIKKVDACKDLVELELSPAMQLECDKLTDSVKRMDVDAILKSESYVSSIGHLQGKEVRFSNNRVPKHNQAYNNRVYFDRVQESGSPYLFTEANYLEVRLGMSGGYLRDSDGRVLGILSAMIPNQDSPWLITIDDVLDFVEKKKNDTSICKRAYLRPKDRRKKNTGPPIKPGTFRKTGPPIKPGQSGAFVYCPNLLVSKELFLQFGMIRQLEQVEAASSLQDYLSEFSGIFSPQEGKTPFGRKTIFDLWSPISASELKRIGSSTTHRHQIIFNEEDQTVVVQSDLGFDREKLSSPSLRDVAGGAISYFDLEKAALKYSSYKAYRFYTNPAAEIKLQPLFGISGNSANKEMDCVLGRQKKQTKVIICENDSEFFTFEKDPNSIQARYNFSFGIRKTDTIEYIYGKFGQADKDFRKVKEKGKSGARVSNDFPAKVSALLVDTYMRAYKACLKRKEGRLVFPTFKEVEVEERTKKFFGDDCEKTSF